MVLSGIPIVLLSPEPELFMVSGPFRRLRLLFAAALRYCWPVADSGLAERKSGILAGFLLSEAEYRQLWYCAPGDLPQDGRANPGFVPNA